MLSLPACFRGAVVTGVALLAAATAPRAAEDAPANLLANPGFENLEEKAAFAAGWRVVAGSGVTVGQDRPHGGARTLRFRDESAKEGISCESKHLPCEAGAEYSASVWVRFTAPCRPGLYLQFHDDLGRRIAERHVQPAGPCPEWTRLTVAMPPPEDAEEVSVLLYAYIGDVGEFECDDAALTARAVPGYRRKKMPEATVENGEKKAPVTIAGRLQLFVDRSLIDARAGADLVLHSPVPREVAFAFDRPWEGETSAYPTVLKDGDVYRAYYRGSGHEGTHEVTGYAESRDGITWTKPALGLFEFGGSRENSIVWMGAGTHNFAPFLDANPKAKPEERYKALAGGPLVAFASPDGIHWRKMREEPVITKGAFDSQNVAFYDAARGRYAAFFRGFHDGLRAILTATSEDFLTWSEPQWIDMGDAPAEHLYTNATTPYFRAPDILLSFPKRFVPERKWDEKHAEAGLSDGVFMTSRDGVHFDRTFPEAFLRPGPDPENWTERNMMIAFGVVPTGPAEMSVYYEEHYRHATCRLRRGALRTDGFVSVRAGYAGGEILTRPLVFTGKELVVNYATSAAGSIRVELQDAEGKALPGFVMGQCPRIYGDEIERVVRWEGNPDLGALAGKPVRLRVRLKDADLYSFRVR